MGEEKSKREMSKQAMGKAVGVETIAGKVQVQWDANASATPYGQMVFFIEFLKLAGLYERWLHDCPLDYQGGHASSTEDIIGTWFLSILSGHRRYAHITTLRADGVLPELLGMQKVVSEDTVRRGLAESSQDTHIKIQKIPSHRSKQKRKYRRDSQGEILFDSIKAVNARSFA